MTHLAVFAIILASILLSLYIVIGVRLLRDIWLERRRRRIADLYDDLICQYLSPAESLVPFTFPGLEKKLNREVLVGRIHSLITNLTGVEARMLLLMFRSNALFDDVFTKYVKGDTRRLCMILAVFGQVPAPVSVMFRIAEFMYDDDRNVRMFALLASLNYAPKKFIHTLKSHPHPLSMRDYANIYSFVSNRSVPLHNVELLLGSKNRSVARLGEVLMKAYGVKQAEMA